MSEPFYVSRSRIGKVDRALAGHVGRCPTARSLLGAVEAVEIEWSADVSEASA